VKEVSGCRAGESEAAEALDMQSELCDLLYDILPRGGVTPRRDAADSVTYHAGRCRLRLRGTILLDVSNDQQSMG
jgi:hypothetical protein